MENKSITIKKLVFNNKIIELRANAKFVKRSLTDWHCS